ncbi:MAG: HD domain-containing protein [Syntrophorhabdaceae bacterium]|nr:HD domain-containing protein [Syntrophorhabdaceae bacterium]
MLDNKQKERLSSLYIILDEFPVFLVAIGKDGKTLRMNATMLKALECSLDEVEEVEYLTTFVHEEDRKDLLKVFKEIADNSQETIFENRIISKTGRVYFVEWHGKPIFNAKGSFDFFVGIGFDITRRKNGENTLAQSLERLHKSLKDVIDAISMTVEVKDPYTAGHHRRVALLARAIAQEMGLSNEVVEGVRMAGQIHDIGKIAVPSEILTMPRKLTALELSIIKTHPDMGFNILKDIDFPYPLAETILQHHERLDGSGYPRELKGDEIIVESRILAVADVVEAIASHRPYRPAQGIDIAILQIDMFKGVMFDENAVDACIRLFKEKGFNF